MNSKLILFACAFTLLGFSLTQCAKPQLIPEEFDNEELLFPMAAPMDLRQSESPNGIGFVVGNNVGAYLNLSIYETPPELINGRVEESTVPLWSFFGPVAAGAMIVLEEGTFREDVNRLDEAYFLCNPDNLFWAGWSWEDTAHFVTFSSKKINPLVAPGRRPSLKLSDFEILGNGPADTLIRAGSEVRLQLNISNEGGLLATDIRYSLRQDQVPDLPRDQVLDDIPANGSLAEIVVVDIPASAVFGDEFTFQLLFTSNDCIDVASEFKIRVNSIKVSLVDVRLTRILYVPDGGLWDFCALPASFNPDVYYQLFSPTTRLYESLDIDDVLLTTQPHVVDFPNLTPPIELAFDTTYRVEFWDDDFCFVPAEDDFIGLTEFTPLDYSESRPGIIYDTTERIISEIHLLWE